MKASPARPRSSVGVQSPGPGTIAGQAEWCVALGITAWVLVLQCMYAGHAGPLWRDEASSVNFSNVPTVSQMWDNFRFDNFPPLFAFVLRGFGELGFNSDISYRILGLAISVLVLGAIWIGTWLLAKRPPLVALAMFAINPLAIKTDGAVRPYGLGYAFLILTIALIYKYARQPRKLWFILACVAGVLSVQTLYQSAFFIGAAIFAVLIDALAQKQRRVAAMAILIGCIAACSLAINAPHLLHDWSKTKWVGQSSFEISKIDVTWQMLASAFWRAVSTQSIVGAWLWCAIAVAVFVLGLRNQRARPFVLSLVFGIVIYLCFLRFSGLHAQSWYFLIVMAVSALWLEGIAATFAQKTIRQGMLVAALLAAVVAAPAALDVVRTRSTSIDLIAQTLRQKATGKDVVLTMPWYYGVTLGRYYDHQKFTTVPPLSDISIHRYDLVQRAMETPEPIAGLMRDMEQSLRNGGTVWTIGEIISPDNPGQAPMLPTYTPGNGYSDSDYLTSWSMQIADFLARHGNHFGVVTLPPVGRINPLERPEMAAVTGWHD